MTVSAGTLQLLMEAGLTGEALLVVVRSIEADNGPSQSSGADRQRRYRERKKEAEASDVTSDVTPLHNGRDAAPSPNKSPPDPQKLTPTPAPTGRRTPRAREMATRLPDDWKPGKLDRSTVAGQIVENRGQEWARRALEAFRNHWRSANGPNARKRDWQAAFANWIIEQDNRDGKRTNGVGRDQPSDGLSATARAALAVFGPDPGDGSRVPQ